MTRLSADDLRARLGGVTSDPAPMVEVPQASPDLVASTMERYRNAPAPKAGFRRGAAQAEAATPAPAPAASGKRPNKYGAACINCGGRVEAEAGYLAKTAEGKWAAEHVSCPTGGDPVAEAVAAQEQEVPAGFVKITALTGQTYIGLQPGIYTLETAQGHRTFRVRVQGTDEDFAPGKTILEYLSGPNNEKDYTGFAFLNGVRLAVWKKHQDNEPLVADAREFLADPSKALLAAKCIRCNANLSTPESVRSLMGKVCREKGW